MLIHDVHTAESILMTPDLATPEAIARFYPLIAEGEHRFPWFGEHGEYDDGFRITVEFDHDDAGKCKGALVFITRDGAAIAMFGVALCRAAGQRVWMSVTDVYSQLTNTQQGRDRNWVLEPKMPTMLLNHLRQKLFRTGAILKTKLPMQVQRPVQF